jgi:hypothetical protein
MSMDDNFVDRSSRTSHAGAVAANVVGERIIFHAAMNSRFFESLQGSRLSVGQTWFDPTLGESPAAAAGPNQKKFNGAGADPVANRSDLFAFAQFA